VPETLPHAEHAAVGRREGVRGVVHSKHLACFLGNLVSKSTFQAGVLRLKLPNASLSLYQAGLGVLGALSQSANLLLVFVAVSQEEVKASLRLLKAVLGRLGAPSLLVSLSLRFREKTLKPINLTGKQIDPGVADA